MMAAIAIPTARPVMCAMIVMVAFRFREPCLPAVLTLLGLSRGLVYTCGTSMLLAPDPLHGVVGSTQWNWPPPVLAQISRGPYVGIPPWARSLRDILPCFA